MLRLLLAASLAMSAAPALCRTDAPRISHHQHLISPATAILWSQPAFDGAALLKQLDEARIARAVVLSVAYSYADERKQVADPAAKVRAENDWTAGQVATAKGRLRGFCSVNPLTPDALGEIDRCTRLPGMNGLKLHFGNSGVDLRDPAHAARLATVFAAANTRRTPIVVHMRARSTQPYGAEHARIFLDRVLPAAPDTVVQVAHLGGAGPGFPAEAEVALAVLADAIARRDPRTRNLWFDVTTVVTKDSTPGDVQAIATRLRQIGIKRVVFGADLSIGGNATPAEAWRAFRDRTPLTAAEFRTIARNTAPYWR